MTASVVKGLVRTERASFCQTLEELGPDVPTLCSGWPARHLAAHIAAEDRLGGVPVLLVVPFVFAAPRRYRTALRQAAVGDRVTGRFRGFEFHTLVDRLRRGPGRFLAFGKLAPFFLMENWIHHEDLRRANQMPARRLDADADQVFGSC